MSWALYIPHPFFVASALLFAVAGWAFVSERGKVKRAHPKTLHPIRLAFESAIAGALFPAIIFMLSGAPSHIDTETIELLGVVALGTATAYFAAPYMGYNLFYNARIFDGAALWLCLLLAMCFLDMGIHAR